MHRQRGRGRTMRPGLGAGFPGEVLTTRGEATMTKTGRGMIAAMLLSALPIGSQAQQPQQAPPQAQQAKPAEPEAHTSPAEAGYQGAPSPLANEPMYQSTNPKAPPMTQAEFDLGRKTYFERCAGCHGVLRKGATGKPLTPDITLGKGTDYLKVFIAYGSPAGMPNWLTSGELDQKTVGGMARYIQQDPPQPPEYGREQMKATRKVIVPPEKRPTTSPRSASAWRRARSTAASARATNTSTRSPAPTGRRST